MKSPAEKKEYTAAQFFELSASCDKLVKSLSHQIDEMRETIVSLAIEIAHLKRENAALRKALQKTN